MSSPLSRALTALSQLSAADFAIVRRMFTGSGSAGGAVQRQRAHRRYEALHRLIEEDNLPIHGREAWLRIWNRFALLEPELSLTVKLPEGITIDSASTLWLNQHGITCKALRAGYLAWRSRQLSESSALRQKSG
jgi:hypothetical protein